MVQVIENRADVRGRVASVAPHPTLDGYTIVNVALGEVAPVPGYANMFADRVGTSVDVNVSNEDVARVGLAAGHNISARIRRTGPQAVFADAGSIETV